MGIPSFLYLLTGDLVESDCLLERNPVEENVTKDSEIPPQIRPCISP